MMYSRVLVYVYTDLFNISMLAIYGWVSNNYLKINIFKVIIQ